MEANNLKERAMSKSVEVIAIMRMGEANVYFHLKPIAMSPKVSLLRVIRPFPPIQRGTIEKSIYYEVHGRTIFQRLWRIYRQAVRLGMHPEVKLFVSFFAFPYGLIALLAGLRTGKPVHIGFVGSDWYRYCRAWYGRLLDFFFRRAKLLTVTGTKMKQEMVARHYSPQNIFHLPHAIDVEEYVVTSPDKRKYDCIFVGHLVPLKRVDLIISAINLVKKIHTHVSLCIVGDGPLRLTLEAQVLKMGLQHNIFFAGFQPRPAKWFSEARIVIIASDREGLPFALVEGMAAGAVPVCTDVGTIPNFIDNEKTGLLVPPGDTKALAASTIRLMEDKQLYSRMQSAVLAKREEFRFENVATMWSKWISMMCN